MILQPPPNNQLIARPQLSKSSDAIATNPKSVAAQPVASGIVTNTNLLIKVKNVQVPITSKLVSIVELIRAHEIENEALLHSNNLVSLKKKPVKKVEFLYLDLLMIELNTH